MYKAINRFKEEIHDNHIYEVNDPYPAEGKKLVKARAEFLTKVHAKYKVAFLEALEDPKKATSKQAPKQPSTDEKSDE